MSECESCKELKAEVIKLKEYMADNICGYCYEKCDRGKEAPSYDSLTSALRVAEERIKELENEKNKTD